MTLISTAHAIYKPEQQTPLTLLDQNDGLTTVIPITVPIPNSATPSLGNVTVVVGPGLKFGITTSLKTTKEPSEPNWTDSEISLFAKSNNPTHAVVNVVPIAIPIPALNSSIKGNATITVNPKGGIRVGGGFQLLGISTGVYSKGLTLKPFTRSSSAPASDLKKKSFVDELFSFAADQCKVASDCDTQGRRNIPCACAGLPGLRKCQCIDFNADNTLTFN
ncbi:hypothetical protein V8F20_004104 [Naviculisporaceae sp. PSN 640]